MEKNKTIVLAGAGGHALSLLENMPHPERVAGYLAPQPSPGIDLPWLGPDSQAAVLASEGYIFHIAFVYASVPMMDKRRRIIDEYEKSGASFATIIAPTAIVTPHCLIGEGAAVLAGAIVNRAKIGRNAIINTGAIVEHDCSIGDNTFIGPGVTIGGATSIGHDCFIGLGASIRNGITIAPGICVGMGSVVTRNLSAPGIYAGNPLRHFPISSIHHLPSE